MVKARKTKYDWEAIRIEYENTTPEELSLRKLAKKHGVKSRTSIHDHAVRHRWGGRLGKPPLWQIHVPKKKNGKARREIDYNMLKGLCKIHCTAKECASAFEMDYTTLNRIIKRDGHGGFATYYQRHKAAGTISIRRKIYTKGVEEGNTRMLQLMAVNWLDWNITRPKQDEFDDGVVHDTEFTE